MNAYGRHLLYQLLLQNNRKTVVEPKKPELKVVSKKHETIEIEPLVIEQETHIEEELNEARVKYRRKK